MIGDNLKNSLMVGTTSILITMTAIMILMMT